MRRNRRAAPRRQDAFNASRRGVRNLAANPPVEGDPYIANVVYLANFLDAVDGATTYAADIAPTGTEDATFYGGAEMDTAIVQGTNNSSLLSTRGNGGGIEHGPHADYYPGTDDFTAEIILKPDTYVELFMGCWAGNGTGRSWIIGGGDAGSSIATCGLEFQYAHGAGTLKSCASTETGMFNTGDWVHIAVQRTGSTGLIEAWADGVPLTMTGTAQGDTNTIKSSNLGMQIARYSTYWSYGGNVQAARYTAGVKRYSGDFSSAVPTGPFLTT